MGMGGTDKRLTRKELPEWAQNGEIGKLSYEGELLVRSLDEELFFDGDKQRAFILKRCYLKFLTKVIEIYSGKTKETFRHSLRSMGLCNMLVSKGFIKQWVKGDEGKEEEMEKLFLAGGLVHDIGKMDNTRGRSKKGDPSILDIVLSPEKLTTEDRRVIDLHSITGLRLIEALSKLELFEKDNEEMGKVSKISAVHHEPRAASQIRRFLRWPEKEEEAIILGLGIILSIVDRFEARFCSRGYSDGKEDKDHLVVKLKKEIFEETQFFKDKDGQQVGNKKDFYKKVFGSEGGKVIDDVFEKLVSEDSIEFLKQAGCHGKQ